MDTYERLVKQIDSCQIDSRERLVKMLGTQEPTNRETFWMRTSKVKRGDADCVFHELVYLQAELKEVDGPGDRKARNNSSSPYFIRSGSFVLNSGERVTAGPLESTPCGQPR